MLRSTTLLTGISIGIFTLLACKSKQEIVNDLAEDFIASSLTNGVMNISLDNELLYNSASSAEAIHEDYTIETSFKLASLTKVYTKLVILKLVEQGLLDLNATIAKYRPDFKAAYGQEITIENLLQMQSGLPREIPDFELNYDIAGFAGAQLDTLQDLPLSFTPGEKTEYSNLNYWLLGAIIESVTSKNVQDAYTDYLFKPLELSNSGFIGFSIKECSKGYIFENNTWIEDTLNYSSRYTSGGAFGSINDFTKIANALQNHSYLNEKYDTYLFSSNEDKLEVYGYLPSATNAFIIDRKNNLVFILLNNIGFDDPDELVKFKNDLYAGLNLKKSSEKKKNTIQVDAIAKLNDSIPKEASFKQWIHAIEEGNADKVYSIIQEISPPSEFEKNDPVWDTIIATTGAPYNMQVAGWCNVTEDSPKGLQLWLISDGEPKLGLLWVDNPSSNHLIETLFITPIDMEWMGQKY